MARKKAAEPKKRLFGYCQPHSPSHRRCPVAANNGSKAPNPIVTCECDCHEGEGK